MLTSGFVLNFYGIWILYSGSKLSGLLP